MDKSPLQITCRRREPKVEKQAFAKTQWCRFYLKEKCVRGSSCSFAHSCEELKVSPDFSRTRICRLFKEGKCNDSSCQFAHGYSQLRSTCDVYKTQMCTFYAAGSCKAGDLCRYAHGEEQLRVGREVTESLEVSPENSNLNKGPASANSASFQTAKDFAGFNCFQNAEIEAIQTQKEFSNFPTVPKPPDVQPTEQLILPQIRKPEIIPEGFAQPNYPLICDSEGRVYGLVPVMVMLPNAGVARHSVTN